MEELNIDIPVELVQFLGTCDQLKSISRVTKLTFEDRRENSAEHSWHVTLIAMLFQDYANEPVDIEKVMKMLILHDVPEIVCGDTFLYDCNRTDSVDLEKRSLIELTANLPLETKVELVEIWEEFVKKDTIESKYAAACDRFHPLLHNYINKGGDWVEHGTTYQEIVTHNESIKEGSARIWHLVEEMINSAMQNGWIKS